MTHWQNEKNRTHMKKYMRKGTMTKKQLIAFFGHKWEDQSSQKTTITVELEKYKHCVYSDKNGALCDVCPVESPKDDAFTKEEKLKEASAFLNQNRGVPLNALFA